MTDARSCGPYARGTMAEQARVLKVEDLASRAQAQVGGSRVDSVCETMAPAEPTAECEPRHGGRVTEADFASLLRFRSEAEHRDGLPARPNVRVEAGPTVLRLAREAHHVPRRFAGQVQRRWASPRPRG